MSLLPRFARRAQRSAQQRAALAQAALASSERERRELARRLHDGPIQVLAAAAVLLRASAAGEQARGDRSAAARDAAEMVTATIRDLRRLTSELVPSGPGAAELGAAVDRLARATAPPGVQVSCEVRHDDGLGDDGAAVLYRVCRELIRNAAAHSGARAIDVSIVSQHGAGSRVVVQDDGAGFDPDAQPAMGHIGLSLIRELAAELGGSVAIESGQGRGTQVVVALPDLDPARTRADAVG